jgi:hypothetical protein
MFEKEGPVLEEILHRMAQTPQIFLDEPWTGSHGKVHVDAVISDLLVGLGGEPLSKSAALKLRVASGRNRLRLMLLAAWLFSADWFQTHSLPAQSVLDWIMADSFSRMASLVKAGKVISDADRREEFVRRGLGALGLRPAGETAAQAEDQLATLDSVGRQAVLAATRAAEQRAREVREAMRRKEAERSVPKYSRE